MKTRNLALLAPAIFSVALVVSGCGGNADSSASERSGGEWKTIVITPAVTPTEAERQLFDLDDPPEPYPPEETEAPGQTTATIHGTDSTVSLPDGTLVWLPATGEKFHDKNDFGNINPDKAEPVKVKEAVARGYDACEKCYG